MNETCAELLTDSTLLATLDQWRKLQKVKGEVKYNIFSMSSYTSEHENFHSDIVASLLNPEGEHQEGRIFLDAFLEYLQSSLGISISKGDFLDPCVKREQGRIDILIHDRQTHKAIIIENKINDAMDQDKQLDRYYEWCVSQPFDVSCILYVSLDGLKIPPRSMKPEVGELTKMVAFFDDTDNDLHSGWLRKCIGHSTTTDTRSLLIQYSKLLRFLGLKSMERKTMEEFYQFVDERDGLARVAELSRLVSNLPEYRMDNLRKKISLFEKQHAPFEKMVPYNSPCYYLLEYFREEAEPGVIVRFKVDIKFEDDGTAWILLWVPEWDDGITAERAEIEIKKKYEQIKDLCDVPENKNHACERIFSLDEFGSMHQMDEAIYVYLKELLVALRKTQIS